MSVATFCRFVKALDVIPATSFLNQDIEIFSNVRIVIYPEPD
jgi:hypothetical protein